METTDTILKGKKIIFVEDDLFFADLEKVNLYYANLQNAILDEANFTKKKKIVALTATFLVLTGFSVLMQG